MEQSRLLLGQGVGGAQWGPEWLQWGVGGRNWEEGACVLKGCSLHCLRLRPEMGKKTLSNLDKIMRATGRHVRKTLGSWAGSARPEQPHQRSAPGLRQGYGCWWHWPSLCL